MPFWKGWTFQMPNSFFLRSKKVLNSSDCYPNNQDNFDVFLYFLESNSDEYMIVQFMAIHGVYKKKSDYVLFQIQANRLLDLWAVLFTVDVWNFFAESFSTNSSVHLRCCSFFVHCFDGCGECYCIWWCCGGCFLKNEENHKKISFDQVAINNDCMK